MPVIRKVVSLENTDDSVREALRSGPYGRCVYHCDNDVVDHQVVNLEFENGVTASFTMCAFTWEGSRTVKIMGALGQITGDVEENEIQVVSFATGNKTVYRLNTRVAMPDSCGTSSDRCRRTVPMREERTSHSPSRVT